MKIEDFDFHGKQITLEHLTRIMENNGFIHGGQWDYERVTYDYKMLDQTDNATYFIRLQAFAVSGEIPKDDATVEVMTPFLGRHYYPHGVEYDETFPDKIVRKTKQKIESVYNDVKDFVN
ncbi:YugN family protein [Alteribacillus sp. HJP-4]|uniref:YugN family protein n=1 Tax=Alteribacillus sp. HJP-4 TaxID=2775394 RepID=UPI0035CD3A4C